MSHSNERKVIHSIRTQVDNFGRKKYKLEEVVQSGSEEQENQNHAIIDTGRHKSMLIGREEGLNIDKYIGKIDSNRKKKPTEVFYCDVCSEGFKCDMAYLTHLNSPAHNRKLGMNMKVKNVSLQTVSSKISALMNKKQQKAEDQEQKQLLKQIQNGQIEPRSTYLHKKPPVPSQQQSESVDPEEKNEDKSEADEIKPDFTAKKQQEQKESEENQDNEDSNELAEMQMMKQMGFGSSFGNKKHKR